MRPIPYFYLLLVFVFVLSGCESNKSAITPVPTETQPPLPNLTERSVTPAPSFTPLPTDTPTLTSASTMIPTLPEEEARIKLLELLSDNGGCRLPCLWAVTLGKSTYQEAQDTLAPLASISGLTGFIREGGTVSPVYVEGELEIYTAVGFLANPDNNIVYHISFNAEAHRPVEQGGYENVFDSEFFGDKVSTYMLPHVLSEQGPPSSVSIATLGGPLTRGGTGGFDILLLYPNHGILVNYTTQMHLVGANVRGCPSNAHVEVKLYPPGHGDSFFELLEQIDWSVKNNWYKPLEEVTSMSVGEFYEAFRKPTDKCIETPANLWPIPEP